MTVAAPPPGSAGGPGWDGWIGPRTWVPAAVLAVLGIAVFGVLFALGAGKDETVVKQCTQGEPGCELRQPVHWHADFAVYVRDQQIRFDDPKYISHEDKKLSENVHIHDPRHTVVHVHREQTTWEEFFRSLGWEISDTCLKPAGGERLCSNDRESLKFVVNGVRVDSIRTLEIGDLQRVLISYGSEPEARVAAQFGSVTDQACIPSEACAARAPSGGDPPEPCAKSGTACN